jgi:inhibitor of cysteine peptidase
MFHALDELKNWLGALFVILLLTGGCSTSQIFLDDARNNTQQELARGQELVVTLASNPTTGFRWEVAEADKAILRQLGNAEYKSSASGNPPLVGAGGTETFRFESIGAGTTTLKLVYRRSWETGVPPIKTYTVQVAVR